jgi:hypothetical protein
MLEKRGQKGKFWCGQNLPFCLEKTQKNQKMSGGGNPSNKTNFTTDYE